uniref:Magnesium transporter NIPA2 n=1 Tax=Globodera pallida TaxID=36090 RepID=A0A183CG67_GLOPA
MESQERDRSFISSEIAGRLMSLHNSSSMEMYKLHKSLPTVNSSSSQLPLHFGPMGVDQSASFDLTSPYPYVRNGASLVDFYIGLGLAISSSLFIEGGYGYLKEWLWWMGVITMGIGEACNFAAYAFAPASLVTPMGALSVLVTAVLSSKLLKERLNLLGKIGCAICLLGSTSIVIHSPKEEEVSSMAELAEKMKASVFILYVALVLLVTFVLVVYVAPRYGHTNILVYIAVCSLVGSLSVISVKGLGLAIKESITTEEQFTNWLTWFWLLAVLGCISVQLVYLNKSLDIYNTSMVTPIYYVFFTSFVILASSILYKEWACLGASDVIGNVIGFLTTVIGIFQMQLFRDIEIGSLKRFRLLCTTDSRSTTSSHISGLDEAFEKNGAARTPSPHSKIVLSINPQHGDMARFSPQQKCNVRASPWTTGLNDHRGRQ